MNEDVRDFYDLADGLLSWRKSELSPAQVCALDAVDVALVQLANFVGVDEYDDVAYSKLFEAHVVGEAVVPLQAVRTTANVALRAFGWSAAPIVTEDIGSPVGWFRDFEPEYGV